MKREREREKMKAAKWCFVKFFQTIIITSPPPLPAKYSRRFFDTFDAPSSMTIKLIFCAEMPVYDEREGKGSFYLCFRLYRFSHFISMILFY